MKFRLLNKKLGVQSLNIFSEFEYNGVIRDICFVKDLGFLCISDDSLLLVNNKCTPICKIDNPMSICQGDPSTVYVVYDNGIKSFNYQDNYFSKNILGLIECNRIFEKLQKIGKKSICMSYFQNVIGLSIPSLHKFYFIRGGVIEKEFGLGIAGYSLSTDITQCSLHSPRGICVYDTNTIFVSDTGNGVIRSFGKNHGVVVGKPLSDNIIPTKIVIDRQRKILYYLSKNYLRSVTIDGNRDIPMYENDNILSMDLMDDGKIYVLEGV